MITSLVVSLLMSNGFNYTYPNNGTGGRLMKITDPTNVTVFCNKTFDTAQFGCFRFYEFNNVIKH